MTGFQTAINLQPAPAVEGDFCSANPRSSLLSGPGAFVSAANAVNGDAGLRVGRFAWADQASTGSTAGLASNNYQGQAGAKIGFVHRDMQASITTYLAETSTIVLAGQPVTLHATGDFWARFAAGATAGQKVFANLNDGSCSAAAAGASVADASFTGVIAVTTGILTVSALTGTVVPGQYLTGTNVPANTRVGTQLTGTAGSTGTYNTNIVTAVSSTAMVGATKVETGFFVDSTSAAGELSMISSRA